MNLNLYQPTILEQWITERYKKIGIRYAHEMDMDVIAAAFRAVVETHPKETKVLWDERFALIYLYAGLENEEIRRMVFFHELGHVARHSGDQSTMSPLFIELQEQQSNHFQNYAAMPAYLLEEFTHIDNRDTLLNVLSQEFVLPLAFVKKRLEQIERRMLQVKMDKELMHAINPSAAAPYIRPSFIETQTEMALVYECTEYSERPSSVIIRLNRSIHFLGRVFFPILSEIPKTDPEEFGHLTTAQVNNHEIIWTDVPGLIGIDLPKISKRVGPLEVDQLLIKLEALDYSLQTAIVRSNPHYHSSF